MLKHIMCIQNLEYIGLSTTQVNVMNVSYMLKVNLVTPLSVSLNMGFICRLLLLLLLL